MGRLAKYLVRQGIRKGLLGGSKAWLGAGGLAFGARFAWRVLRRKPTVAFSEKLGPGQRLVITHRAASGHNGRRESPASKP